MPYYQHYSFDLWLTLIKSNPDFKIERTKIFHRDFNPERKPIEEVAKAFRQVDLMCNAVNETTGKNIDSDEMYLMVISLLNDNKFNLHSVNSTQLYNDMETLLFNYVPFLYSAETITTLEHLKQKSAATLSILSNTGFIKGTTLRKVLAHLGIGEYFDFQLYSDEVGLSKPNPEFFYHMLKQTKLVNGAKNINLENIIHIGDNPKADVEGACAMGINTLLINSNNTSILSLIPSC